jgi:hypothetical protein
VAASDVSGCSGIVGAPATIPTFTQLAVGSMQGSNNSLDGWVPRNGRESARSFGRMLQGTKRARLDHPQQRDSGWLHARYSHDNRRGA